MGRLRLSPLPYSVNLIDQSMKLVTRDRFVSHFAKACPSGSNRNSNAVSSVPGHPGTCQDEPREKRTVTDVCGDLAWIYGTQGQQDNPYGRGVSRQLIRQGATSARADPGSGRSSQ